MKKEEALQELRCFIGQLTEGCQEAIKVLIPELKEESEDERIREWLIDTIKAVPNDSIEWDVIDKSCVLAYLEKQKEPDGIWTEEDDVKVRAMCKEGDLKPSEIVWLKELKNRIVKKEQKPVQFEVEREYVRTLKSLISDFLRGKEDVDREYYQQIFDWLDGRHIEQKPVDFPTTDEEVNEFLETHSKVEVPEKYKTPDFVFSKQEYKSYPIISKDTTSVKPAEWSEEDEKMRDYIIHALTNNTHAKEQGPVLYAKEIAWLQSLKNRGNFPKSNTNSPSEWSEEDEKMRKTIIQVLKSFVSQADCESNPSLSASYPTYYKEIDWFETLPERFNLQPQAKEEQKPEVKHTGWVARDRDGEICIYEDYPEKDSKGQFWLASGYMSLDQKSFPDLKWKDEPMEVEVTIRKK